MAFVLDASVTGSWAFDDEDHPLAVRALDRLAEEGAIVPGIWWFEVRNILIVNERRGRIDRPATARFLRELARLPITIDREPAEADLLQTARTHRLSVYDAAYLELAERLGAPLATLDQGLASAGAAVGVASV